MAEINLTKNDSGLKVNLVKGANQDVINSLYTQTKALRDETSGFKDTAVTKASEASNSASIASTKATEASNSATIALEAIQYLTDLTVVANEGLTTGASYDDATNTLTLTLVKGEKGDTGSQGIQGIQGKGIDTVTSSKVGKTTTVTITGNFDNSPKVFDILDGSDGTGDMLKSIYDANNNGIVDNAQMLTLDTSNTSAPTLMGQVKWNIDENTADLNLGNVTLQLGQEQLVRVRNDHTSTILNGRVVMATGTLGNSGRILVKPHTGTQALAKTVIGVATEDITVGSDGFVTTFGKVRNIDTTGSSYGETWVDGDILYIKPNDNGALTKVVPANNEIYIPIAMVIKAHSSGTLFVRASGVDENRLFASVYTKTEIDTMIGDINSALDTINGEVI